ncbi:hypothetical protein K437DRAFT_266024 [Tilletiaria anomala UBC 951]|uniref:Uncharacterized protein n=1 Tax=Tilletiaria anomala (strain ATCC 24038 / CBS 436.72 / UBC 951) TaxID=1037660 RepID=A0A066WR18_TILAU|nr:uncharacterized protein K437DRAFT_266024 [Tilletiaria anomala UBC 951]KDN53090.1 hypothetical protein K437DRAFT_266024 [Tilletiaria anomala UBC 951]
MAATHTSSYGDLTESEPQFLPSEESAAWQLQQRQTQPHQDPYISKGMFLPWQQPGAPPSAPYQQYPHHPHQQHRQQQSHRHLQHQQTLAAPYAGTQHPMQASFPHGFPPQGMLPGTQQLPHGAVIHHGMPGASPVPSHSSLYNHGNQLHQAAFRHPSEQQQEQRAFNPGMGRPPAPVSLVPSFTPYGARPHFSQGQASVPNSVTTGTPFVGANDAAGSTPSMSTPSSSAGSSFLPRETRAGSVTPASTQGWSSASYGGPSTPGRMQPSHYTPVNSVGSSGTNGKPVIGSPSGARRPSSLTNSTTTGPLVSAPSNLNVFSRLPPLPPLPQEPSKPSVEFPPAPWSLAGLFPSGEDPISATRAYVEQLEALVDAYRERERMRILQIEALAMDPTLALQVHKSQKSNESAASQAAEAVTAGESDASKNQSEEGSVELAPILGIRLLQKVQELADENEELGRILSKRIELGSGKCEPDVERLRAELTDAHTLIAQMDKALTIAEQRRTASEQALAIACATNSVGISEELATGQDLGKMENGSVEGVAPLANGPSSIPTINMPSATGPTGNAQRRDSRDHGRAPSTVRSGGAGRGGGGGGARAAPPRGDRRRNSNPKGAQG